MRARRESRNPGAGIRQPQPNCAKRLECAVSRRFHFDSPGHPRTTKHSAGIGALQTLRDGVMALWPLKRMLEPPHPPSSKALRRAGVGCYVVNMQTWPGNCSNQRSCLGSKSATPVQLSRGSAGTELSQESATAVPFADTKRLRSAWPAKAASYEIYSVSQHGIEPSAMPHPALCLSVKPDFWDEAGRLDTLCCFLVAGDAAIDSLVATGNIRS